MSGHVAIEKNPPVSSADVVKLMEAVSGSTIPVVIVGYGAMGREYLKALQALKLSNITVCTRSEEKLQPLKTIRIRTVSGGYSRLPKNTEPNALAIVSTPTSELILAIKHLLSIGYKRILCEKPVALNSQEIEALIEEESRHRAEIRCAYNRVSYPAVIEARYRIAQENGATSCFYTFTELIRRINPNNYSVVEQERWGIANSLHVMSLAHHLAGLPKKWDTHNKETLPWHKGGAVFVGSGVTDDNVLFSYHADWLSLDRWSVQIYTRASAYRLCPLEKLFQKTEALADWREIPISIFSSAVKPGLAEEIAAMLDERCKAAIPLFSLGETARLTRFGEDVFGYENMYSAGTPTIIRTSNRKKP